MVENEIVCANQPLTNNLTSFGTFFFTFQKKTFGHSFSPKLDPCSRGGPVRVAVDDPYGYRGGLVL